MEKFVLLEALTANLKEQLALYRQLQEKILQQEQALLKEDFAALQEVLGQKDEIIRRITYWQDKASASKESIARDFALQAFNLTELSRFFASDQVDLLKEIMDEMTALMEKMLETEKQNETLLREKMGKVETALRKVRRGKQVGKAYQGGYQSVPVSVFFDKKQ